MSQHGKRKQQGSQKPHEGENPNRAPTDSFQIDKRNSDKDRNKLPKKLTGAPPPLGAEQNASGRKKWTRPRTPETRVIEAQTEPWGVSNRSQEGNENPNGEKSRRSQPTISSSDKLADMLKM